jgi:hypothetical protein
MEGLVPVLQEALPVPLHEHAPEGSVTIFVISGGCRVQGAVHSGA